MAQQSQPPSAPPEPPELARKLALSPEQRLGLPILLVIPLLAMFGVFGERHARESVRGAEVELQVRWPSRTRFEIVDDIDIVVRNVSARAIDTLTVAIDSSYLAAYSGRATTPAASEAWTVELVRVQPGEARHVIIDVDARRPGRIEGAVAATSGGPDTARVMLHTIIFP